MPTLRCSIGSAVTSSSSKQHAPARVGRLEPGDDAQHRGLAAARGTEQHHGLAGGDVEVERLERARAVGEGLARSARGGSRPASVRRSGARARPRRRHCIATQQRHDHHEEDQRVGAADLQAHRGVGVGEADGQRLGERRVQHPGHVELAHRQRDHHQRAGEDARARSWAARCAKKRCAEARRRGSPPPPRASSGRSAIITASTERTMKGSVKSTWPTRMKSQLVRKSRQRAVE